MTNHRAPTAPVDRAQANLIEHLQTCRAWCWLCAELMNAADTESRQRHAPVDRAWPAPPDVVVRAFEHEHAEQHAMWRAHVRFCWRCIRGQRCRIANDLADRADVAGKRWEMAEERSRR